MWFVYIVECADGSYYTGITTSIEKRISTHNIGKGSKYTRARLPVVLIDYFSVKDRSIASKEEYKIKKMKRANKLQYFRSKNEKKNKKR